MSEFSRRSFLQFGAGSLPVATLSSSLAGAERLTNYKVEDQVPFGGQTRRLKLTNNGRCISSLIFATDYPTHFRLKPEFYPVCTPQGVPVTDSHQYCFIHHQSIMTGHGKVRLDGADRDVDFYRKLPYRDEQREDRFHTNNNLFNLGPSGIQKITSAEWEVTNRIALKLTLEWQSREANSEGGQPLIIEQRRYNIFQRDAYTVFDQSSRLVPTIKPFTMKADRHSFVGVRVHDLIDPDEGGVMRDSEGRINPDGNYWDDQGERKAPKWIDCTGRIGNQSAGVALFCHPQNVRNEFYCRGWGLMICSATLGHEQRVSHEEPFHFAARFVAHDGELTHAAANALYEEFAASNPSFAG